MVMAGVNIQGSTIIPQIPSRAVTSTSSALLRTRAKRLEEDPEAQQELLFLTDISRPQTEQQKVEEDPENINLEMTPRSLLEPAEVRKIIYKRECQRLNVVPLGTYLRTPIRNNLLVRHCNIGPRGAIALSAPLMLDTNITFLDLAGNYIQIQGFECIMKALKETMCVTHLDLSENRIGSEGAKLLSQSSLKKSVFEYLALSDNDFRDEDSVYFADIIESSRSLRELILSHNHFGEIAGPVFAQAIATTDRLEVFDISWNYIRRGSATTFARGVKDNVGLKKLNMSFNGLGKEGATGIALVLKRNRTLTDLDISNNRMVDADVQLIGAQLAVNETLRILKIGDNLLTQDGALHLLYSVKAQSPGSCLEILDMQNTSVEQEFAHLLMEVKRRRDVNVIHGKVMNIGKPRKPVRRRVRKKPDPNDGRKSIVSSENSAKQQPDTKKQIRFAEPEVLEKQRSFGESSTKESTNDSDSIGRNSKTSDRTQNDLLEMMERNSAENGQFDYDMYANQKK